jgi:anti-anti-sigma factor
VQLLEHAFPGVMILELNGRLTVETEAELKEAVRRLLDVGWRHIVLDLARVPYIDSCGLGTMVQGYVSAQRLGGWLKLMNVNGRNRQLLTVTRLLTVFEEYEPTARAVGA